MKREKREDRGRGRHFTHTHTHTHTPSISTYSHIRRLVEEPEVPVTDVIPLPGPWAQPDCGRQNPKMPPKYPALLPSWGRCDELFRPWFCYLTWQKGFTDIIKVTNQLIDLESI